MTPASTDNAAQLVIEIRRGDNDMPVLHRVTTFPVRIGRGYDNDIIVNDPYVSPTHCYVTHDEATGVFSIKDAGSLNGTYTGNARDRIDSAPVPAAGLTCRIGQTDITLIHPHHPVPPAIDLLPDIPLLQRVARPRVAWTLLSIATVLSVCISTTNIPEEESYANLIGYGLVAVAMPVLMLLWAAFWAGVGRLMRRAAATFYSHLSVAAGTVIAAYGLALASFYARFLNNDGWIGKAVTMTLDAGLTFTLLSLTIALVTGAAPAKRRMVAACITAGILAAYLFFDIGFYHQFSQEPHYGASLAPFPAALVPAGSLDALIQ